MPLHQHRNDLLQGVLKLVQRAALGVGAWEARDEANVEPRDRVLFNYCRESLHFEAPDNRKVFEVAICDLKSANSTRVSARNAFPSIGAVAAGAQQPRCARIRL